MVIVMCAPIVRFFSYDTYMCEKLYYLMIYEPIFLGYVESRHTTVFLTNIERIM